MERRRDDHNSGNLNCSFCGKSQKEVKKLIAGRSEARLDYVEFFDPETLQPIKHTHRGTHMALAVFFGKTRLIDNVGV